MVTSTELPTSKNNSGIASNSQFSSRKTVGSYECLNSISAASAMTAELRRFATQKLMDQRVQNYLLLLVCQKGLFERQIMILLYATDEGHLEMTLEREGASYKLRSKSIYFTNMQLNADVVPSYAIA